LASKTKAEVARIIRVELLPAWGHRRLPTIEPLEVQRWGEGIAAEGRGYMANRCHEYMRLIWNWGLGRAELRLPRISPFLQLPKPFAGEERRNRVLTSQEIRKIFAAIQKEPRLTAGWWIMCFLTAAHDKSEVLSMEKQEISFERQCWIVPREKAKAKRTLAVPLTDWALEVLKLVLPISGDSPFVFPSPKGQGARPMTSTRTAATRMQKESGVNFQIRDIRRTVAAGMAELGIDPEITDRVLNHRIPTESKVTATYQTDERMMWVKLEEKREALKRWADHLDNSILEGKGREITLQAIEKQSGYEGWRSWAKAGRVPRVPETWRERKARLAGKGRDLNAERRARNARRRKAASSS
jgi:integrase